MDMNKDELVRSLLYILLKETSGSFEFTEEMLKRYPMKELGGLQFEYPENSEVLVKIEAVTKEQALELTYKEILTKHSGNDTAH